MCSLELSPLSNELIQSALNQIIENYLKSTKYTTNIGLAVGKGDNFHGAVYRVLAQKTSNNDHDENPSEMQLILKVPPQQRIETTRPFFMREIYMFSEVRIMTICSNDFVNFYLKNYYFYSGFSIFP